VAYFVIAGEVSLVIGMGLACLALVMTRRAASTRAKEVESCPFLLPEFRLDGSKGRDVPSSCP
jgi:hypothetical protein